jgi:hypothetical protein
VDVGVKHLVALGPCACKARRYVALRERKHVIELMLIHETGSGSNRLRKYMKVTSLRKEQFDYHARGNQALRGQDSLMRTALQLRDDLSAFVTKLKSGTTEP